MIMFHEFSVAACGLDINFPRIEAVVLFGEPIRWVILIFSLFRTFVVTSSINAPLRKWLLF